MSTTIPHNTQAMESLVLILMAPNAKEIIDNLIYLVAKNNCFVEESRFASLGNDITGMLRISGSWNAIAKMEDTLAILKTNHPFWLEYKRSSTLKLVGDYMPYIVQIMGVNQPTLLNEIGHFFVEQHIQLIDLQTDTYRTNYADTRMLTLVMRIHIPSSINIADLRERFMLLCEEINVDGILEPEKPLR